MSDYAPPAIIPSGTIILRYSCRTYSVHVPKQLIERGEYREKKAEQGWVYYEFPERNDNLVCAAVVNDDAIIIKTVMIRWQVR